MPTSAPLDPTPRQIPTGTSLAGASVLVVGGSSGIGLATARLLVRSGARVTVAARDGTRLARAGRELAAVPAPAGPGTGGAATTTVVADVTDPASLDALFHGRVLDHVYVAAGGLAAGAVVDTPAAAVRVGVEERIWGAYEVAQRAVPRLRPGGSLTFTSGPSAVRGVPGLTVSSAHHAGIEAFARALALEIAPLRANVVRPGQTDTPFLHGFLGGDDAATVAAAGAGLPLGRVGHPDEVAGAVLFLMTNGYVTGSTLAVDGGTTI